jgi:hypothetical protein
MATQHRSIKVSCTVQQISRFKTLSRPKEFQNVNAAKASLTPASRARVNFYFDDKFILQ